MAVNVKGSGPRDGLPDYVVKGLQCSETGLFTGRAERHFKVGSVNQRIDPSWLIPANAPACFGSLPCVSADAAVADGICTVGYFYQGQPAEFTATDDNTTFELDTSMAEERIETHPKFDELKKKYGWDVDTRAFSENLPNTKDTSSALSGQKKTTKKNPLFGTDSWLVVGVIFRKTYTRASIPSTLLKGIGSIVKKPSGIGQFNLPDSAKKRNWLKLSPKIVKKGNSVEITEEWMLSGPNGWQEAIYSQGQLDEREGQ